MGRSSSRVKAVFDRALELESAWERKSYLDEACDEAPDLRQKVEALLGAYEEAGSFLERPAPEVVTTLGGLAPDGPGTVIGPYKLIQSIGEGGMGAVFMAEQTHPVQRLVALKAIKPGMDSRQILARFEAERQALAMMDHPNIAKVLDAGTTATGRPYFVMELVKGVPITRYCDECRLTLRERLELFVPVCQAVQHAHQKGIIHRDLKPSNVLIAPYDGRPVPKVIDFGVAKATGPRLTERTLYTEFGAVVGTLEYMSPEQAQLNQLDIDTRSDVYALGVLLYELLTGMTPLDHDRLERAELLEVLRIIREEEPPKPSARLSTTHELLAIATNRGMEPNRLSGLVRGDLDWIVMKCLEKDRNRRYETANSLALDLRRYLNDEPVLACPPSAWYSFRKFVRRNLRILAVAGLIGLMLVGAVIGLTISNVLISREQAAKSSALVLAKQNEQRAKVEADKAASISDLLLEMFTSANPDRIKGAGYTVRELLDDFSSRLDGHLPDQPEVEAALRRAIGIAYRRLGMPEKGGPHLEAALALRRNALGEEHAQVAESLVDSAWNLASAKDYVRAETRVREALAIDRQLGVGGRPLIETLWALVWLQVYQGQDAKAERTAQEALTIAREVPGADGPVVANILHTLADSKVRRRAFAEAEPLARDAVEAHRRWHGAEHPETGWGLLILAKALAGQDNFDEAVANFRAGLNIFRKHYGPESKAIPDIVRDLRSALRAKGDRAGIEALNREVVEETNRNLERHQEDIGAWLRRVLVRAELGEWEGVAADLEQVIIRDGRLPRELKVQLAGLLATNGPQPEAALAFARCLELDLDDHMNWYFSATIRLDNGDTEGHHRACREMLESFGGTATPEVAERIAKMCLLTPDVVDPEEAQALALRMITGTDKHPYIHYFLMVKGLADYRAGQYAAALERLKSFAPRSDAWSFEASALAIQAMTYGRLGRSDEGREILAHAWQVLERRAPPPDRPWGDNWQDWLHARTLCREAEALLDGPQFKRAPPPRTENVTP
jgi:serine/threonine protein kinase